MSRLTRMSIAAFAALLVIALAGVPFADTTVSAQQTAASDGPAVADGSIPAYGQANWRLAARFAPYKMRDLLKSTSVQPRWIEGTERFWYRYETSEGADFILVDPMLATGNSVSAAISRLKQAGAKDIRFVCLLSAPEGIAHLREAHPDVPVFTAAIDSHLNDHGYIVPGLGDAGDRMFGTK